MTNPEGVLKTEYIMQEVLPLGLKREALKFNKTICDAVKWSCTGRYVISSIQILFETD